MKLQKSTRLALCAVLEFASKPERQFSAAEIAGKYRASVHHLAKVLHRLRRAGLVVGARGAGGGYRFVGNPKRVTLLDVITLFERISAPPGAARGSRRAERGSRAALEAALDAVLAEIDETAKATFGSITLETLLRTVSRDGR